MSLEFETSEPWWRRCDACGYRFPIKLLVEVQMLKWNSKRQQLRLYHESLCPGCQNQHGEGLPINNSRRTY